MSYTLKNTYAAAPKTTRGQNIVLSPDPKGKNILYCNGNLVFIRDVANPLLCDYYGEHANPTTAASYAPSGNYIASGDQAGKLRVWATNNEDKTLKVELQPLSGAIRDIAWSGDNQRIAVVGEGKDAFSAVFGWDTGSTIGSIGGASKRLISCDFKKNRPYRIATGGEEGIVQFFTGVPFKFGRVLKDHQRFVNAIRFSPDESMFLTASSDKQVFLYESKSGDTLRQLDPSAAHTAAIWNACWSPDSKQILTVSADKTAKLWDAASGALLTTFTFSAKPDNEHQQVGCAWLGSHVVTLSLGGDLTYLDVAHPSQPHRVVKGHMAAVVQLAVDQAAGKMYTADFSGIVLEWDIASGANLGFSGTGHSSKLSGLAVAGGLLVSTALDDTLRATPLGSRNYGEALKLDAQPVGLAVGRKDASLALVATSKGVLVVRGGGVVHSAALSFEATAVALSVDECEVAVGAKDGSLHFFALSGNALKPTTSVHEHRHAVTVVKYSPDGRHVASGDALKDVVLYDAASKANKGAGWVYHTSRVNDLAWHEDGVHLASASLDKSVIIYNADETTKRVLIKNAHYGGVEAVAWADKATVLSAGRDCCVRSWDVQP